MKRKLAGPSAVSHPGETVNDDRCWSERPTNLAEIGTVVD